jgi:hypothetical protein
MAWGDFAIAVGEEVGITRINRSYGGFTFAVFGTVTKINGHGHIFVKAGDKEYRFTRRGDAYKDEWGPSLMHAAQLRAGLAQQKKQQEQARLARELENKLKEGWTYGGRFHMSEELVSQLKEVIVEMEKLVDH